LNARGPQPGSPGGLLEEVTGIQTGKKVASKKNSRCKDPYLDWPQTHILCLPSSWVYSCEALHPALFTHFPFFFFFFFFLHFTHFEVLGVL
jgi:hypothetical protein